MNTATIYRNVASDTYATSSTLQSQVHGASCFVHTNIQKRTLK